MTDCIDCGVNLPFVGQGPRCDSCEAAEATDLRSALGITRNKLRDALKEVDRLKADQCHACGSISGVYYHACDDCVTRMGQLQAEVERLRGVEADVLAHETVEEIENRAKAEALREVERKMRAMDTSIFDPATRKYAEWSVKFSCGLIGEELKQLEN